MHDPECPQLERIDSGGLLAVPLLADGSEVGFMFQSRGKRRYWLSGVGWTAWVLIPSEEPSVTSMVASARVPDDLM